MECPGLRRFTSAIKLVPLPLVDVELINIVKPLLIGVYTSKYINVVAANYCAVSVPALWWRSICPVYLIPVIRQKAVLKNIIHGVMSVPASEDKH